VDDKEVLEQLVKEFTKKAGDNKISETVQNEASSALKRALSAAREVYSKVDASKFKDASSAAIKQFIADLNSGKSIAEATAALTSSIGRNLKTFAVELGNEMFGDAFVAKAAEGGRDAVAALKGAISIVAEKSGIKLGVDLDITKPESILKAFAGDVAAAGINLGIAQGFDEVQAAVAKASQGADKLIGNLDRYRSAAGEISKIEINPFGSIGKDSKIADATAGIGKETALTFQEIFSKKAINLRETLAISAQEAQQQLSDIYGGLENSQFQLSGFNIGEIEGAEALAVTASALGMEVRDITSTVNELTFTMGATGEQAKRSIETIAKAASNTLLPVNRFHKEVMTAAGQFELFGDNTEEAAAMLDRFISKAAPNRIGASVQAFQSVARGIAGMSDEMKAFISMGTDLAGGGGAIESIVRLDAALESGDKDALQGIFDEAIARIEELSGAPVMTLQEAVASGQEQTFHQQVKMLEQMGLGSGSAQASYIFDASRRGAVDVETVRARLGGDVAMVDAAKEKARYGRGALDVAQEELGAGADFARFNAAYANGAANIMKTSDDLAKGFVELGTAIAGKSGLIDALKGYGVNTDAIKSDGVTVEGAVARANDARANLSNATVLETQGATANTNKATVGAASSTNADASASTGAETGQTVSAINYATARVLAETKNGATNASPGAGDSPPAPSPATPVEVTVKLEMAPGAEDFIRSSVKRVVVGAATGAPP